MGYGFHAATSIPRDVPRLDYSFDMTILSATRPPTEAEIDGFLHAFESCTLPKAEWTHAAHLTAGACFVHQLGETAAVEHMRLCIPRYNESVGGKNTDTSGYHDTITVFWIKVLASLHEAHARLSRAAFAALAVERYGERRDLFREFYDFDVVASTEARRMWIPPAIRAIEAASV